MIRLAHDLCLDPVDANNRLNHADFHPCPLENRALLDVELYQTAQVIPRNPVEAGGIETGAGECFAEANPVPVLKLHDLLRSRQACHQSTAKEPQGEPASLFPGKGDYLD